MALGIMGWLEGGRMAEAAAGELRFSMAGQSARAVAELRHENFEKLSKAEQQGDILFRRTEAGAITDAEASSLFPEVDQRLKAAAKSPGRPGYMQRGKDFLSNMHKAFTRHFIHLDPKQDGAVINILQEHQEAATAAWEKAGYTAVSFLKDLSPAERNVFTMNLVLADMIRDIDSELLDGNAELPFGYQSRDQAQKDLDHFQVLAERTPAVKATANRSRL